MTTTELPNIRHLTEADLIGYFDKIGEKKYRVKQLQEWLWQKHAPDFDSMSNFSLGLREKLGKDFLLPSLKIDKTQTSSDGTVKSRFKTYDNYAIEGVLIPTEERKTACVSSQVGCSLSCKFCATGFMGRKRNLTFDEIYDQVAILNQQSLEIHNQKLTNIVFMGMGEPLMNYQNIIKATDKLMSEDGMHIGARRITVSTAVVSKQIMKLGDDKVRFKLALSLHAPTDAKRNQIMPINESNNIKSLIGALNYFYKMTDNEITFEYILFRNFNDSIEDAQQLIKIYRQVPADLVNIIEYNPIGLGNFHKPDEDTTTEFMEILTKSRVNCRLRQSRGKDIDAACGQLANK